MWKFCDTAWMWELLDNGSIFRIMPCQELDLIFEVRKLTHANPELWNTHARFRSLSEAKEYVDNRLEEDD